MTTRATTPPEAVVDGLFPGRYSLRSPSAVKERAMKRRFATVAVWILAAGAAQAQVVQNVVLRNSFNPVGSGSRGLGMGGAFIAVADDGTAASFNPAGLAQLRRSELAIVGFGDELDTTLVVPQVDGGRQTLTTTSRHGAPDFVGLSVPFEAGGKNLTVQLSYQRAVDLFGKGSVTLQNTLLAGELGFTADELRGLGLSAATPLDLITVLTPDQSGAFHTATAAGAYQVTSRLSLGLSVNYWLAEWRAQGSASLRVVPTARPGVPRPPVPLVRIERTFLQDHSMRGINLSTGFLLRYSRVSIGGVLRLPFSGDYNLIETGGAQTFALTTLVDQEAVDVDMTSRLRWPRSAGIGVAIRPFRGLTMTADYTTSHWSRTLIESVPGGALLTEQEKDENDQPRESYTDRNFFDLLPASLTSTADTDQLRVGAEYLVSLPKVVIPLRVGAFRDQSPVPEFGSSAGRRIDGFTVGTGLNFSRVVLDVAFESRESEGLVGLRQRRSQPVDPALNPSESVKERRVVASLIYRFGDNDPIKRLLRHLFVGGEEKGDN
jgi:hypothetical protein